MEADLGDKASLTKVFGPRCNTGGEAKDLHTYPCCCVLRRCHVVVQAFAGADALVLITVYAAAAPEIQHGKNAVDAAKEVCGMCQHT